MLYAQILSCDALIFSLLSAKAIYNYCDFFFYPQGNNYGAFDSSNKYL